MVIKKMPQIGEDILRAKAKKVTDFNDPILKRTITNLRDTMRENKLYGIAAPQIGKSIRLFITEITLPNYLENEGTDEYRVFINPKIISTSKATIEIFEGCGSVLNGKIRALVKRPKTVQIEAFDKNGKKFRMEAAGILGRVILHEYDHLDGILFTDRIDPKNILEEEVYRKKAKSKEINLDNIEYIRPKFI